MLFTVTYLEEFRNSFIERRFTQPLGVIAKGMTFSKYLSLSFQIVLTVDL